MAWQGEHYTDLIVSRGLGPHVIDLFYDSYCEPEPLAGVSQVCVSQEELYLVLILTTNILGPACVYVSVEEITGNQLFQCWQISPCFSPCLYVPKCMRPVVREMWSSNHMGKGNVCEMMLGGRVGGGGGLGTWLPRFKSLGLMYVFSPPHLFTEISYCILESLACMGLKWFLGHHLDHRHLESPPRASTSWATTLSLDFLGHHLEPRLLGSPPWASTSWPTTLSLDFLGHHLEHRLLESPPRASTSP